MEGTQQSWRLNIAFSLIAFSLAALGARAAMLTQGVWNGERLVDRDEATRLMQRQQVMIVPDPGKPGNIYCTTHRGMNVLLAASKKVPSIYADPQMIPEDRLAEVCEKVGDALGVSPAEIQRTITGRHDKKFVWLAHAIKTEQAKAVMDARIEVVEEFDQTRQHKGQARHYQVRLPGIAVCYEWRRQYPNADRGATVTGFCQGTGEPGGGMELKAKWHLMAQDGYHILMTDSRRNPLEDMVQRGKDPKDGGHVFLTIDDYIQGVLQEQVQAAVDKFGVKGRTFGMGIVADPQTGDILGIVSVPTYDPGVFTRGGATPEQIREAVAAATNRCISVTFEPGSAFKPIMAAAAVDAGVVTWNTRIDCAGGSYTTAGGGTVTDHGSAYGLLTVTEIISHSSNIGMAKIGQLLGNGRIYEIVKRFGFGEDTGILLPGESRGIVTPLAKMDGYATLRVPFGQQISVSQLQLVMAYCALANGGKLMKPRLIDTLTDSAGTVVCKTKPEVVRQVLKPQTCAGVMDAMAEVVRSGTGRAACDKGLHTTWGKTGTAQIAVNGVYADGAFTGTFIGGAPVNKPRVVVAISIYWPDRSKGHFGATVAAPYTKAVIEKIMPYLDVAPDREDKPSTPDGGRVHD